MTLISALHQPTRSNPNGTAGAYAPLAGEESRRLVRILVVDDEPPMREMIVNYLRDHHICAVGIAGRQEVARCLAADDPSLVLLDLRLGQDNGLDLLREIRS